MLPWPAVPVAFRRIQARPFSAVWTAYIRWSPTETLNPPTSPIASVTPSNRSGCSCTRNLAPQLPPASSSAVNASTTSRSGLRPSRIRFLTTARTIASMSFMSTAPRPHTHPSAISPANGSQPPVDRVGRHDVQVTVDEEGGAAPVGAFDAGDQAGPLRVRLEHGGLDADLAEQARHVLGGPSLARAGVVPRVGRVDPDQVSADVDDLILTLGGEVLSHAPILAPRAGCRTAGWPGSAGWLAWLAWLAGPPGWAARRSGDPLRIVGEVCYLDSADVKHHLSGWRNGRRASLRC